MEELSPAGQEDLDRITKLYDACKTNLLQSGIQQWGDWEGGYPHREYLKEQIDKKNLFLFMVDENMLGAVTLNREQAKVWQPIPWKEDERKALVIHGLVIHPRAQGKGHGQRLLELCEQRAKDKGCASIRLDAFSGNERSNRLYLRNGYRKRGSVFFPGKPEGHQEYFCYEKFLQEGSNS